jgi:hypothetical protein
MVLSLQESYDNTIDLCGELTQLHGAVPLLIRFSRLRNMSRSLLMEPNMSVKDPKDPFPGVNGEWKRFILFAWTTLTSAYVASVRARAQAPANSWRLLLLVVFAGGSWVVMSLKSHWIF